MDEQGRRAILRRAREAAATGCGDAIKTAWFLVRIIVPISLGISILDWCGALPIISRILAPLMRFLGLPGEAALVFLSAALLNIYSAIAVAGSLSLDLREATILAIMCLTAHNLIVETQVMRKSGSSGLKMAALRIGIAIAAGWAYSRFLPASLSALPFSAAEAGAQRPFGSMILAWSISTARLTAKIAILVVAIMVVQRLLEEFAIMDALSRLFAPMMRIFGLPAKASFLWIVINVVGYAYGAGIVAEHIASGRMKPQEGDLFNHHASVCHSLVEDTALFLAVGLPLFWLIVPRLALAAAVVWFEKARRHFVRRSFRVGVN